MRETASFRSIVFLLVFCLFQTTAISQSIVCENRFSFSGTDYFDEIHDVGSAYRLAVGIKGSVEDPLTRYPSIVFYKLDADCDTIATVFSGVFGGYPRLAIFDTSNIYMVSAGAYPGSQPKCFLSRHTMDGRLVWKRQLRSIVERMATQKVIKCTSSSLIAIGWARYCQ